MRPAWSVILLTTLIGAGHGLFLALVTAQSYALVGLLAPVQGRGWYVAGSGIALGLLVAGLGASFFHLGRPERAWRSAAQWRTSWLSREVIVLPAFMAAVALYGLLHALDFRPVLMTSARGLEIDLTLAVGGVGTVLAFALFVCTGMVYACLRFLAEWHTPLTPLNYTLLGGASGFTLAAGLAALVEPPLVDLLAGWAIVLTAMGAIGRGAALLRNARLVPKSTIQSAIGVKHPVVTQRAMGFMGGSFNTREFFHGASPARFRAVRPLFVLLAFVMPLMLLVAARPAQSAAVLLAAFAVQFVGLLAERWFFFAQARHPQNLYYQHVS
ncbi:MAG TPA: dimethyl sulfoxide reductase anchor subunit [Burkholderiaceae bacterium]|nr:dimethyl sulfoxide reductase anchor subunit [Burkholderiaceae bacterium]